MYDRCSYNMRNAGRLLLPIGTRCKNKTSNRSFTHTTAVKYGSCAMIDEFTFFPFTSPNPKGNRRKYHSNTDSKVPNISKGISLQRTPQSDCGSSSTTKTNGTEISSIVSGFDRTFDKQNTNTMLGQRSLLADFADSKAGDTLVTNEEKWVTFGAQPDATPDTQNDDLSPMSTKVQVGQADTYDEKIDLDKDGDPNDDTVTSTTDYDDDADYGPVPATIANLERTSQSCIETSGEKFESNSAGTATTKSHILMLVTNMGMNRTQVQNQQRATMMLNALNIIYETIDGSDPLNKEVRNELFAISEIRGAYPQFFIVTDHGDDSDLQISFLGDFETFEGINDSSSLPNEILDANPTLLTWSRIPYLSYQK